MIHSSALVSEDTEWSDAFEVGPFAVVGVDGPGGHVVLGSGARIRSHVVLYRASRIGQRFHAAHGALVREECVIGDDVSLGSHSVIEHHVRIGRGVRIHSNAFIPEFSVLADGCWIGPSVTVTNARYPNRPDTKENLEGVHVGQGAVIGAAAVLLPGVRIGPGALVGAGSVVVKDVPPGETVMGNPAGRRSAR